MKHFKSCLLIKERISLLEIKISLSFSKKRKEEINAIEKKNSSALFIIKKDIINMREEIKELTETLNFLINQ